MTILFVENMYRTYFWQAIANNLSRLGFQIAWLVQNHLFAPKEKAVLKVPYPKSHQMAEVGKKPNSVFRYVSSTDRLINHFQGKNSHYPFYYNHLNRAIEQIRPMLVIGESTLFHELLIIEICKKRSIPYLHPSSSSYPPNRFSFYLNDTKTPFGGERHLYDAKEYDHYIEGITHRRLIPDYMKTAMPKGPALRFPNHVSLKDKFLRTLSYIQGEKFNTPNPIIKLRLQRSTRRLLGQWDDLSRQTGELSQKQRCILYPMQMQPEANLDVWGNENRNQASLIRELSVRLPNDWLLVVKANPKPKYELTKTLVEVIRRMGNIVAVDRRVDMAHILPQADLLVTVTGTVAIEAVLSNKAVAVLGPSIATGTPGCYPISSIDQISDLIRLANDNSLQSPSIVDKRNLMHKMLTTSYQGIISDPISNPSCMSEENVASVTNAFVNVIDLLPNIA